MNEFFQNELFSIAGRIFTIGQVGVVIGGLIAMGIFFVFLFRTLLPRFFDRQQINAETRQKIKRLLKIIMVLLVLLIIIIGLQIDLVFFRTSNYDFSVTTVIAAALIVQFARLIDWLISRVLLTNYKKRQEEIEQSKESLRNKKDVEGVASRAVQYIVYVFAFILILQTFNLDYTILHFEDHDFRITNIAWAILIMLMATLFSWVVTQLILRNYYKKSNINLGSQYAINQLLKYVIFTIAAFMALESMGIQMTVVWGGAAALLVGVGLGLQQTFNDLISGIILLFERSVEVGNVIEVNSLIGTVQRIGLRTSIVETRDNITVIVPNSKLITENVVNWSHYDDKARFHIEIGVAYGSDTQQVKQVLLEVAKDNVYVLDFPSPIVRFISFGDSALLFELHFWSHNFAIIEDIKSDLRFGIDKAFREHDISIPFPQREVWIRKEE